jgi:ligand-binding SRPBCC domain-containing protein
MPLIRLVTEISAPPEIVFDLSRSVELHLDSTQKTGEHVLAGRTTGLFELGDVVTWRAKHFGIWQTLTVKITEFDRPHRFVDEMQRGIFHHMKHEHLFERTPTGTRMTDNFDYSAPLGVLGRIAETVVVTRYLTDFLRERNAMIKRCAER